MTDAGEMEALVTQHMITAMKAHDAERTGTLRLIKTALKNKAIDKRAPLTPAESEQALATMIKQRRDSIEQFTKGNRPELAAKEAAEIVVIEEFLPKALDEAALAALVTEALAELTAALGHKPTAKEMGAAMKAVQARIQASGARADGRMVSELVKKQLDGGVDSAAGGGFVLWLPTHSLEKRRMDGARRFLRAPFPPGFQARFIPTISGLALSVEIVSFFAVLREVEAGHFVVARDAQADDLVDDEQQNSVPTTDMLQATAMAASWCRICIQWPSMAPVATPLP